MVPCRIQGLCHPTVKRRIDLQVSLQQLKIHTGSTANFLIWEDNSRDLLGKFHKDRSVWIRARRRVLQCLSCQFPCALQLKQWGILKDVKYSLCEKYYRERNIPEPPDSVESVGHILIPKLLLRCGLFAWTRFRLILKKAKDLSGL